MFKLYKNTQLVGTGETPIEAMLNSKEELEYEWVFKFVRGIFGTYRDTSNNTWRMEEVQ